MSVDKTPPEAILKPVFGSTPSVITQEPHEGDPKHLHRLARLRRGDKAKARDLWKYAQDLLYTQIQGPLFTYLLPFCLEAWRQDLRGTSTEYGGFVEYFYPVLADRHVFDRLLSPAQGNAVSDFMRSSILEEIDDQRGLYYRGSGVRPYRWITALTTYGVLLPSVDLLWKMWWSLDTVGKAVAAVQYISCLMYQKTENPVFAPWTPNGGGGPPSLSEFGGHLYAHRWQEANVTFLRRALNRIAATDLLKRAANRLVDQPEHDVAAEILADVPLCEDVLTARCEALLGLLTNIHEPGEASDW